MNEQIKKAIEEYQCPGSDISCFQKADDGEGCNKHTPWTTFYPGGRIFLGMPVGFNKVGVWDKQRLDIFKKFSDGWGYDKLNIPVWKHLDTHGYTLVKGISPKLNKPFIHIFLENCMDQIQCLEISKEDIMEMD